MQQALCAPSRNSMLTSRRPDTLHLYDFYSYWRDFAGNFTTLPQYLKSHGYRTYSFGKIFHPGKSSNFSDDYPYSWTQKPYHTKYERYMNAAVCPDKKNPSRRYRNLICPVDVKSQPGHTLPDMDNVRQAKIVLSELNERAAPFFLAVGLHKPHIPFRFPHKFLQYHHNIDKFVEPPFSRVPYDLPNVAFNPYTDIRDRHDVKHLNISFPFGPVPHDLGLRIRQAYYASVTYMDDLVGELLANVNFNNTIVVLCGDHGWSLGEHAEWAKYSNYDVALRVPLIVYTPDYLRPATGKREVTALAELVDLFPTVVDLARLPGLAKCENIQEQRTCTEGKSLVPYMMMGSGTWDGNTFAFSQYPRPSAYPTMTSDRPRLRKIRIMGYSIRTLRYRYTLWIQFIRKRFRKGMEVVSMASEYNLQLRDKFEYFFNYFFLFLFEYFQFGKTFMEKSFTIIYWITEKI